MIDESTVRSTADRLSRLLPGDKLNSDERITALRCHRRLIEPLRLTIFGTYPKFAISLLNLLAGHSLVPPNQYHARIEIIYSEAPYAEIQLQDGSRKRLAEEQFRDIFMDNPKKVRIAVDLPVLKKVTFLVAADASPEDLCMDANKTLMSSDVVLWAGDTLTDPVLEVWTRLPAHIRDHSYLTLPQNTEATPSWEVIKDEFVGILSVDPRLAQAAKSRRSGIDKEGFKMAGGKAIVKAIKKEIEVLRRSALDAAQIMLIRHDADHDDRAANPSVSKAERDVFALNSQRVSDADPTLRAASETARRVSSGLDAGGNGSEGSSDEKTVRATPWSLGL